MAKGITRPSALSITASASLSRTRCTTQPITAPTATPPAAVRTNSPIPLSTLGVADPTPAAASMIRSSVSAVASLSRLSPSRIAMTRRCSPSRRPTDAAATASGGATMAPRMSALTSGSPGSSHDATRPTTTAVNSTSPTASSPIGRRFSRSRRGELCSPAE